LRDVVIFLREEEEDLREEEDEEDLLLVRDFGIYIMQEIKYNQASPLAGVFGSTFSKGGFRQP
jgi:hypothetical protein